MGFGLPTDISTAKNYIILRLMYIIQSKTKTFVACTHTHNFFLLYLLQLVIIIIVVPKPTDQKVYRVAVRISNMNSTYRSNEQSTDEMCEAENRIQKKHSLWNSIGNDLKTTKKRHTFHVSIRMCMDVGYGEASNSYDLNNLRTATVSDVILISARTYITKAGIGNSYMHEFLRPKHK